MLTQWLLGDIENSVRTFIRELTLGVSYPPHNHHATMAQEENPKSPSYRCLHPASEDASRVKRRNRRNDTKQEVLLRRELWRMGLRYRKNVNALPGRPDLVFAKSHVVVFCDGDFWHGREWESQKAKLSRGTNAHYWVAKLESNIARDARITRTPEDNGWQVIRLWESDIKRDPATTARYVFDAVVARRHNAALS